MPSFARYIIFAVWQIYHIAARRYIIGINLFLCYNKIGVIDVPENKLVDLSFEFAKNIVNLVDNINAPKSSYMVDQLARAGTSVGANIHEAQYAHSKADFVAKLEIALNEAHLRCMKNEAGLRPMKRAFGTRKRNGVGRTICISDEAV